MVATQTTKKAEKLTTTERLTMLTPERSFGAIDEAVDFFRGRKLQTRQYRGEQLSVSVRNDSLFLNIKGNSKSVAFPVRDSGLEGLLQRSGLGMGNFPMKVCDDDLLTYNLNYLFQKHVPAAEFTVILDKNPATGSVAGDERSAIKAVMSDAYTHIPHEKVLNIVSKLDIEHDIHTLSLTRDFFRICMTNPANKAEPKVGDVSSLGVDLLNSENGHAALTLGQYLYRYWCSNGASRIDATSSIRSRAIHRGSLIEHALRQFTTGARHYLLNGASELEANFKALMGKPVDGSFLRKVSDKVQVAVGKKNTEALTDEWQKSIGETECDSHEWETRQYEKYGDNRYDFAQLVTKAAHRGIWTESGLMPCKVTQRLGLEKVGGWIYGHGKN